MGVLSLTDAETIRRSRHRPRGRGCLRAWLGSEAVLCGWGMRDDAVDNRRRCRSARPRARSSTAIVVLPAFGAWAFTANAFRRWRRASSRWPRWRARRRHLFYYKSISSPLGAAKSMALNISYSAWAVLFAFVLQGTVPTLASVVCCVVILAGTILAASDWNGLFSRGSRQVDRHRLWSCCRDETVAQGRCLIFK